jgi:hypothetical protein
MDAKTAGAYNIPVMTSDIAPPTTWSGRMIRAIGERVPFFGTGGMRQSQQAARVSAVQDVMRNYGGEVGTPAVNDVMASLLQKRGSDLSKYSKLKTDVIDKQAGAPVNVANTTAAIDAQIAKLQGMQTKAVNPLIGKLEDYKQAFSNQDLPTIELLRKQLGDELQSPDMATVKTAAGKATSSVYGALKQDMGDHIKQFGDRRDAQKWQVANARLSDMMTDQNVTGLKSALKRGEATPETVRTLLFSKKPSDVELLRKNLTPEGRDAAKQAIMQEAYAKIGQEASPERFVSQMDKLSTQTGVMLNSAEKAELQGLVDALKLTKQASVANFKPATGAEMTGFATPAALTYVAGGNPVAGVAMTAGAGILARAYESAPMRELMIKMGKAQGAAEKRRIYDTMLSVANNLDAVTKGTAAGASAGLLAVPQSDKEAGLLGAIGAGQGASGR